jgi:hypothetical protein
MPDTRPDFRPDTRPDIRCRQSGTIRSSASRLTTALAGIIVWAALVAPDRIDLLQPVALLRIPLEGVALAALVLVLPRGPGRVVVAVSGLALGILTIVRVLDFGYMAALHRPFDPVSDGPYLGSAVGVLNDSIGGPGTAVTVVAAGVLCLAILVLVPLSALRLAGLVSRRRERSGQIVTALGAAWVLFAVAGLQAGPAGGFAAAGASRLAYAHVRDLADGIRDRQAFAATAAHDPFGSTPGDDLLAGLRGKDVIIAFVESYGRVAVQGSSVSDQVSATLARGNARLEAAGFESRSAFLASPTFGGVSWLAHSTLQSGLWVDDQQRYDAVVTSNRLTLSAAFGRAGWRTVGVVPSNRKDWLPGAAFYRYDTVYDARNIGYAGPGFGYAAMPDQFTLAAFQRRELARPGHRPVMAELDLVSSHTPWAPLPRLIPWSQVGDGSVFDGMPAQGESARDVWRTSSRVRAAYGQSIAYSLDALVSFVETSHDDNLVLVVLGDHQPATIVAGQGAGHDVPVSVIAHDPGVLDRISGWGWQDGLRPGPDAPVWRMDAFRDRFLTAYGPNSVTSPSEPLAASARGHG